MKLYRLFRYKKYGEPLEPLEIEDNEGIQDDDSEEENK